MINREQFEARQEVLELNINRIERAAELANNDIAIFSSEEMSIIIKLSPRDLEKFSPAKRMAFEGMISHFQMLCEIDEVENDSVIVSTDDDGEMK